MARVESRLLKVLERLEKHYGTPKPPWPTDSCEMILYTNCGYPASEDACAKGFEAHKKKEGIKPEKILAAPDETLVSIMRLGGIMPELRAARLKKIAARVNGQFGGDLGSVLRKPLPEAKKALKTFPTIGDPGAEKILLFAGKALVAAVPSSCVHVSIRLGFGEEKKSYAASYRSAQEAILAEVPDDRGALLRAYLLLKRHGQDCCKRARPRCDECPVTSDCPYFRALRRGGKPEFSNA